MLARKILQSSQSLLLVLCMNMLFAATFSVGKIGLEHAEPIFLCGARMLIAGLILLTLYQCTEKHKRRIAQEDWFLFAKTIFFYNILAYLLEFWALKYMSSLKTNMLWSCLPFVSALLGYFLLQERLTTLKLIGLFIGTAGTIPMMLIPDEKSTAFGEFFSLSLPELAMFTEVVAYAYGGYLSKRLLDKGYPFVLINGICLTIGGIVTLSSSLLLIPLQTTPLVHSLPHALLYAAALALISDITGYGIYAYLLKKQYTITFLNFSGFLCPVFGAVMSRYIFGELLSYHYLIAFFFILIGLTLFYREESIDKEEAS